MTHEEKEIAFKENLSEALEKAYEAFRTDGEGPTRGIIILVDEDAATVVTQPVRMAPPEAYFWFQRLSKRLMDTP